MTDDSAGIQPQGARDELVFVVRAQQQAEADMIEGMLRDAGIPCVVKRSAGFDVPGYLAAGPRDILVPVSKADVARELLQPPPSD